MFLPPISHHALGTSSCHCCVLHHALGTSSCHSRVPISHWSVCYRRAHHVGQHHWGHQASHAHLWWTETGIHQTPYSSISSRQCLAPGWGSIVFPPSPSPPPPHASPSLQPLPFPQVVPTNPNTPQKSTGLFSKALEYIFGW